MGQKFEHLLFVKHLLVREEKCKTCLHLDENFNLTLYSNKHPHDGLEVVYFKEKWENNCSILSIGKVGQISYEKW